MKSASDIKKGNWIILIVGVLGLVFLLILSLYYTKSHPVVGPVVELKDLIDRSFKLKDLNVTLEMNNDGKEIHVSYRIPKDSPMTRERIERQMEDVGEFVWENYRGNEELIKLVVVEVEVEKNGSEQIRRSIKRPAPKIRYPSKKIPNNKHQ